MPFELSILNWLNEFLTKNHFINNIFKTITLLGDKGFIWIIIGLVLIASKKYRLHGVLLLGSLALGTVANTLIKEIFQRTRPIYLENQGNLLTFAQKYLATKSPVSLVFGLPEIDSYSFASGHTYSSFNAAVILYFTNKRFGYAGFVLATLIAFSRLFFGVHYPSDVLVGAILGVLTALLSIHLFKVSSNYIIKRKKTKNADR